MFEVAVTREISPDEVSEAIMKKIRAPYSHSIIIEDEHTVWQATGEGFHKVAMAEFLKKRVIVDRCTLTPVMPGASLSESRWCAKGWLMSKIGLKYSRSQYVGFLLPFKWIRRLFANGSAKTICSEVQYRFAVECCGMPAVYIEQDYVDPRMAWDVIRTWSAGPSQIQ